MTETKTPETEPSGCRFPIAPDRICGRPTVAASGDPDGRGRPSSYCDNPQHNRAAAWRARRAMESPRSSTPEPESALVRPVSTAGAQAGRYLDETRALAEQLGERQASLLRELATLGDPDAAAVQLETVTAEATQQVAEERARAARAEQARREDRDLKDEADAAAAELAVELDARLAELTDARQQLTEREQDLAASREQIAAQAEQLTGREQREQQLTDELEEIAADKTYLADENERQAATITEQQTQLGSVREQLAAETRRADDAETERQRAEQTVLAERAQTEQARRDAERAHGELQELRSQLSEARAELREATTTTAASRAEVASLTAQLESAKDAIKAEQNHANQRINDQEKRYTTQLAEQRETINQLRAEQAQAHTADEPKRQPRRGSGSK
jgi:colicin import membrane protein